MFKKLKSIFVIEEGVENSPASPSTKAPKNPPISSTKSKKTGSNTGSINQLDKTGASAKPNNKFVDLLLKSIEENNIEGFDYLEYKQSLQSLSKIESDEAKRYQNAFAMAQTMGLSKKKLNESAKRYISVLEKEEAKFAEAFQKQKSTQVDQREAKIKNLHNAIKTKEEQIKKLEQEIAKSKDELSKIEGKINETMAKAEATKDGFYASYNMVLGQIQDDLEKINQYVS